MTSIQSGINGMSKVLKNDADYKIALQEAERLVAIDPPLGSKEGDRLELLALILEDYENRVFQFDAVSPIEAIEFRMAEQGLKQKDLLPFIGSKSRVSEVLSGKRPLTVQMIRALVAGLGIPAESLIGKEDSQVDEKAPSLHDEVDWKLFPYVEMERRGWFEAARVTGGTVEERLASFLRQIVPSLGSPVLFRRKFSGEQLGKKNYCSTLAWTARVLMRVREIETQLPKFDVTKFSGETLRDLGRLSWFKDGPKLAVEFLAKCGVAVIVEPRLSNSVFDGAAFLSNNGTPVIGLTMRIDRIDYFWFTLMHEVAHVWKHLNSTEDAFIDRIETIASTEKMDAKEREAHRIARDSFIRRAIWERSPAKLSPSRENIQELADSLHIHPAIVAGRIQFESGKYEIFREFLGQGTVLKQITSSNDI